MPFEFILYVSDQKRSAEFYAAVLEVQPSLNVPGMTEFSLAENLKLGLMPENGIAKIITPVMPHPSSCNGVPRCELYFRVDDVIAACNRAVSAGAQNVSPPADRDWDDCVGYVSDSDGHVIAFAKKINK